LQIIEMKKFFIYSLILAATLSACGKLEASNTIIEEALKEDKKITDYLAANNLVAKRHNSGMYYIITDPGTTTDAIPYYLNTTITAKYTGRILDGNVFTTVTNPSAYLLYTLIPGWQYGIPLIQKGGKIRLFVPSTLAYGQLGQSNSTPPIPPNAVLDFDIELVDAHN
jgi:FKBP-type peptidyl-prolyl cis-trans isomerase FkpA